VITSAAASASATSGRTTSVLKGLFATEQLKIRVLELARTKRLIDRSWMDLRIAKPAMSGSATMAGRPCRNRPLRIASRETASRSTGRASPGDGLCRRSGRAVPETDRSAHSPDAPSAASNRSRPLTRAEESQHETPRNLRDNRTSPPNPAKPMTSAFTKTRQNHSVSAILTGDSLSPLQREKVIRQA
jgi:hypothetical protein